MGVDNLTITFVKDSDDKAGRLYLYLDDYKNNGKTTFNINGDEAYVMLIPSKTNVSKRFLNTGNLILVQKDILYTNENGDNWYEEILVFNNTDNVKTKFPPDAFLETSWLGNVSQPVSLQINGDTITAIYNDNPTKIVGVLKVRYRFRYDSYKAINDKAMKQIIYVEDVNGNYGTLQINWIEGSRDIVLVIKDACSKVRLPNAYVKIEGVGEGYTDEFGVIEFNNVPYGRYPIFIRKDGYIDNNQDYIENDYIDIKEE